MNSSEIRAQFIEFFVQRGHRAVPSAPVIPYEDPTLLFTNAGMNQFKDVFLGAGKREYIRAVDSQKCIRVSGKHNDLEEVGRDTYHHTFFEMLGNWSFGDYYKKEAIGWAWELLTVNWKLDKRRLYATVYETDQEAEELWKSVTDIDPSHILRFGKKDNFWEMGETGPCGPCSEIHYDLRDDHDPDPSSTRFGGLLVNAGDPRVMEIWNLVFIQNNRQSDGSLESLPAKHVDTGMGFERICAVLQGKKSNYDTDVFEPIITKICELTGKSYHYTVPGDGNLWSQIEIDVAIRVIADHVRMLSFSIADGATPSSNERGGVLRTVINRAARFGRLLNMKKPFIFQVVSAVVESMGKAYPELKENQSLIERIIKIEEERFGETQQNGHEYFYRNVIGEPIRQEYIRQAKIDKSWFVNAGLSIGGTLVLSPPAPIVTTDLHVKIGEILKGLGIECISGEDAFKLQDTYGVHLETTISLANAVGIGVDIDRFDKLMEEQRKRSRDDTKVTRVLGTISPEGDFKIGLSGESEFIGYNSLETEAILSCEGPQGTWIWLNKTPFYTQSGGQVSDTGIIKGRRFTAEVVDSFKQDKLIVHVVKVIDGQLNPLGDDKVRAEVDVPRRLNIERNHSATHLVHEALRRVLGTHLHQQGSLVDPDRLRFDFNHFDKISKAELKAIEDLVNQKISERIAVNALNDPKEWLTIEEAKKRYPNVKMFFGDKYGDHVRVVEIDSAFSVELCGGTHVKNSSDLGLFKITSESSIASGIRRIEAVTGEGLDKYIQEQIRRVGEMDEQIHKLVEEKEALEKELGKYKPVEISKLPSLGSVSLSHGPVTNAVLGHVDQVLTEREQSIEKINEIAKELRKAISKFRVKDASAGIEGLLASKIAVNGFNVVASKVDAADMEELKTLGDALRTKMGSGVGVLASVIDEKVALVCVVSDDLIKQKSLQAGKIVGDLAKRLGGGGGGKPHLATAGGKDVAKLGALLIEVPAIVQSMLPK
jgi:alanyl-tRNA synthetase